MLDHDSHLDLDIVLHNLDILCTRVKGVTARPKQGGDSASGRREFGQNREREREAT